MATARCLSVAEENRCKHVGQHFWFTFLRPLPSPRKPVQSRHSKTTASAATRPSAVGTNASATEMVKLFGDDTLKLGVLTVNNMGDLEPYGNLVTYMRLKKIVPPTNGPGFEPLPKK
jgi:hypothetical protein